MSETDTADGGNRAIRLPGLRKARRKKAMTQRELAAATGVAASTISDLETGRRGAYVTTIRKLKEVLDDVDELIDG